MAGSVGHIGLWTFFTGFKNVGKLGCLKYDFITTYIPPRETALEPLKWSYHDCSSFSAMDIVSLTLSSQPTENLKFNFTIVLYC